MSKSEPLLLRADTDLSLSDVARVLGDSGAVTPAPVTLDPAALERLDRSHEQFRQKALTQTVYGINTGFGPMVTHTVAPEDWPRLQRNLVRSHAMGSGAPLPPRVVRAVLLARLVSLLRGRSAVDRAPVSLLAAFLDRGICPVIPVHGGVGASGDLVQLAHVALAMIGEGEVYRAFGGDTMPIPVPAARLLAEEGLAPLPLRLREGIALMNGTAAMVGIAAEALLRARRLFDWTLLLSCLLQEICGAGPDAFSEELNEVKRHPGQRDVARRMRAILAGSAALAAHGVRDPGRPLQEAYSIRCVPQILGPIHDAIASAEETVVRELNSVSDNPICDPETGEVYHGGNFHGDYVGLAADTLKIALVKLTLLAERQLNFLLSNHANGGLLPPFLNRGVPGLELGLQGAQFTATSTAAEAQTLAFPMSVHSIPCNRENQDVVSMGANAALLAGRVVDNAGEVVAITWLGALQAVDILNLVDRLAPATRAAYYLLRADTGGAVPGYPGDSMTAGDIDRLGNVLRSRAAPLN